MGFRNPDRCSPIVGTHLELHHQPSIRALACISSWLTLDMSNRLVPRGALQTESRGFMGVTEDSFRHPPPPRAPSLGAEGPKGSSLQLDILTHRPFLSTHGARAPKVVPAVPVNEPPVLADPPPDVSITTAVCLHSTTGRASQCLSCCSHPIPKSHAQHQRLTLPRLALATWSTIKVHPL